MGIFNFDFFCLKWGYCDGGLELIFAYQYFNISQGKEVQKYCIERVFPPTPFEKIVNYDSAKLQTQSFELATSFIFC